MLLVIIIIVCLVALVIYGNKLRHKAHGRSLDMDVGDLNKNADINLDETLMRAKEIAMKDGIDLSK